MARGGEVTLEEFKARLPLVEIVGRVVRLTKAGRDWKGLCPFHQEKSPSFHVSEAKGFYHCFGCGQHGTAIDFVMETERLEFGPALERLAEITGIPAPAKRGGGSEAQKDEHERLYAANQAAEAWFIEQLDGPSREGLAYLERRGLDRGTIRSFRLGYAPDDGQGLRRALASRGFTDEEMLAVGLLAIPEGGGNPYARLRQRVIFPIHDGRGRHVGFGGRALGEARAKYLNTPETKLFRKGELLYNLAQAAPAARERRGLILAEGYMDVIALHRAGFPNAVAPLGTAVTEPQLQLLWRHAEAPVVCLDGDKAGLAAAARAAERALPLMQAGRSLRFAVLPEGEDPDSFVARQGAAAMAQVLERAHDLSDMLWKIETQGRSFDSAETQAGLRRRLRELTRLAADPDLRASLDATFRQRLEDAFSRRRGRGREKPGRPAWDGAGASRLAAGIANPGGRSGLRLLAPILRHPAWLPMIEEDLAAIELEDPRLDGLRQEILAWFADAPSLDADALQGHLTRYGHGSLLDQLAPLLAANSSAEDEAAQLEAWRAMLLVYRERQAKRSQRPTEAEMHGAEDRDINLWFKALDHLLNRQRHDEPSPGGDDGAAP